MDEYRRVFRGGLVMLVGMAAVCVVFVVALATAAGQSDSGFDGAAVAVAVLDTQMEQTRRQVIFYDVPEARQACADAAWRPVMHQAVGILEADPVFADRVADWVAAWNEGLIFCYRGDMANASAGIAAAFELKDSMLQTAKDDRKTEVGR